MKSECSEGVQLSGENCDHVSLGLFIYLREYPHINTLYIYILLTCAGRMGRSLLGNTPHHRFSFGGELE